MMIPYRAVADVQEGLGVVLMEVGGGEGRGVAVA
jgi:hypothetical protein